MQTAGTFQYTDEGLTALCLANGRYISHLHSGYFTESRFDAAIPNSLVSRHGQRAASGRNGLHWERDNTRQAYSENRLLGLRKLALSVPESIDRSGGIE